MTKLALLQLIIYLSVILALVKPLGWYMARVYQQQPCGLDRVLKPLELAIYRGCGIQANDDMTWKAYASAMLIFNALGFFALYALQRLQAYTPLNPQLFTAIAPELAFNTASSFITNTNWQAYSGEQSLSYLTQMLGLTVQNFLSAATGMSILVALIRGIQRHNTSGLGNFWVDLVRSTLYILLPLSLITALLLVSQGVIQNYKPYEKVRLLQPITQQMSSRADTKTATATPAAASITTQTLPMGPVASQIAIKQLGSNGGGFFNANSAHPFENPTPLSNFIELLAILLIPAALCYTFGSMIGYKRQGWAILLTMFIIFTPLAYSTIMAEQQGNPALTTATGVNHSASMGHAPMNMEGKETRFSIAESALWATATTATSNGSTNAMLDSFTPLGGLIPLWLMQLNEVVFGGVGSGLYGMLLLVIITVFMAGLMVGRTPEYLGKKIEPYEMKMASFAILLMPLTVLSLTAIAVVSPSALHAIQNPGPHGFTEVLYALTSMTNNNGSAFAGLNANTTFFNLWGSLSILIGRYWLAIPILAIAGSLAQKNIVPPNSGTLRTDTPIFLVLLLGVIIILGALSFLPALALGPIVEHIILWRQYGH